MAAFKIPIEIRWSDLDPNFHVKHSAYYDFGAYCRMNYFTETGTTTQLLLEYKIGPVLLREECVFRRELHFGDKVTIDLKIKKANPDYSRWTLVHEIYKNNDKLSAIITVDGAWIDTAHRKLVAAPEFANKTLESLELAPDFVWTEKK
jgi:acyl-CoA thioester hydrolase